MSSSGAAAETIECVLKTATVGFDHSDSDSDLNQSLSQPLSQVQNARHTKPPSLPKCRQRRM